jgi:hypothetical protein
MLNGIRLPGLAVLGVLAVTAVVVLGPGTASAKTCEVTLSGGTLSSPVHLPTDQVMAAGIEEGQMFWDVDPAAIASTSVYDRTFQLDLTCGVEDGWDCSIRRAPDFRVELVPCRTTAVYTYVPRPDGDVGLLFRTGDDGRLMVLRLSWPFERLVKAAIVSGEPGPDGQIDLPRARDFEGLMKVASARQAPFASMAGSSSPQDAGIQWTSMWPIAATATAGLAVLAALAWTLTRRRRQERLLLRDNAA